MRPVLVDQIGFEENCAIWFHLTELAPTCVLSLCSCVPRLADGLESLSVKPPLSFVKKLEMVRAKPQRLQESPPHHEKPYLSGWKNPESSRFLPWHSPPPRNSTRARMKRVDLCRSS